MHPSYQIMMDLYHKFSKKKKSCKVLDSGCGNGYLLELLDYEAISEYSGYDVSTAAIQYAKKRFVALKRASFKEVKINQGMPKYKSKYFDTVFSIGVLQYLSDMEIVNFFQNAKKIIQDDGLIFISCTTDHPFYKWFSLYNLVLPSHVNNRNKIIKLAKQSGLDCIYQKESGLFLGPLFSHNIVLFFDAIDKIVFRTKGRLGFFGMWSRLLSTYILKLEYYIPIDFGYTMYLVFKK